MSQHLIIDDTVVDLSRYKLSQQIGKTAAAELYGLRNCGKEWGEIIAKHLILNAYDCTGFETLNQSEANCLIGKAAEDLAVNNC
jgi:hypothetical protein